MKYTTTANFSMVGTAGSLTTGVLDKLTGKVSSGLAKARNWVSNAQKAKQEVGTAAVAKQRLMPRTSPNAAVEAMAKRKYGSVGVETAPSLQSTIGTKTKSLADSQKLREHAALRSNLTHGSAKQINRTSADRFSRGDSKSAIADNRSLRVKYTKDPRTGKLVSAAYKSSISFLCDI